MTDDMPVLRRHIFLTGEKQVGKSTLLRKLIDRRALDCAGFETRALLFGRRAPRLHAARARADAPV